MTQHVHRLALRLQGRTILAHEVPYILGVHAGAHARRYILGDHAGAHARRALATQRVARGPQHAHVFPHLHIFPTMPNDPSSVTDTEIEDLILGMEIVD